MYLELADRIIPVFVSVLKQIISWLLDALFKFYVKNMPLWLGDSFIHSRLRLNPGP
jgi:hypothetical protein